MLNFTVYNMEFCEIKMLLVIIKCSRKMKINKTGDFFLFNACQSEVFNTYINIQ
jgi:hypothetical protein